MNASVPVADVVVVVDVVGEGVSESCRRSISVVGGGWTTEDGVVEEEEEDEESRLRQSSQPTTRSDS